MVRYCTSSGSLWLNRPTWELETTAEPGDQLQFVLPCASNGAGRSRFASISLADSCNTKAQANGLQLLPVGAKRGRKQQQFAWDGHNIIPVNRDLLNEGYTAAGRFQDLIARLQEDIHQSFLPRNEDVTSDYWEWLRWRLGQRLFSATMQNFATQSLLMAVGVGARKALAASAAINWMLKDGMNRLVRMGVATQFGDAFDSDLKRFRFATSVLFTTCVTCEFLTPLFPNHFLLLASIANVGRAVGLTTFVSTQPAFQQALCTSGNMADLASKTQAQHMVMDTLALAISASANYILRYKEAQRMMLPLVAFPICAVGDLFCIFHELKAVQLRTLNRERGEMIAERWLEDRQVPSFADISSSESLLGPPNISGNLLPMRMLPLEKVVRSPDQLQQLMGRYKGSKYMLAYLPGEQLPWWHVDRWLQHYCTDPHIGVALARGANTQDVLTAVLEAGYLRKAVAKQLQEDVDFSSSSSSSSSSNGSSSSSSSRSVEHRERSGWQVRQLTADVVAPHMVQAKGEAERSVGRFMRDISHEGWQTKAFLLSKVEKEGYVRLD